MRRPIHPYKANLKALARKLRQNMTFSEVRLWNELKRSQMLGYDFDRQRPIGNYIVDFYCKELQLVIEVDGFTHDDNMPMQRDIFRQQELEKLGIQFLRFKGLNVIQDMENVLRVIEHWIMDHEEKCGVSASVLKRRKR